MTSNEVSGTTAPSSILVTFLLADIRGYTSYTAARGDDAGARHSEQFLAVCRNIAEQYGGEDFGTAGDQALLAFPSAGQALRAALALSGQLSAAQQREPEAPWHAGIGLDTGDAIRVGHDYRGAAINLAARLCSLAGPDEIFASQGVISSAHVTLGIATVDRGAVTLKGLDHPVRVLQVFREGEVPAALPPLQSTIVTPPTNLPDDPTPFVGRERDLRAIGHLIREPGVRLVTLTGTGGSGKTRLALQAGAALLHSFRDGVFFVDLSSLTDPVLVAPSVASVLNVHEEAGADLTRNLIDALREKQLLLVVDNFEHLMDASPLVATLLDACRELNLLITSRFPLHLSREHEYSVSPLSVPDPAHLPDLDTLARIESVALFIDRARAAKHEFALTENIAAAVAAICARLEGLPLALELAAARLKLFTPQALLQRLSSRLTLLTGGARDRPSRQQTLRNTIDWSYSLLTEDEQTLLARLSVFAGGCTFESAETVCNWAGDLDLLEGMASLVDKSLVRQVASEEPRFTMLETIRDYASERLQTETARRTRKAHAAHYLALSEEAEAGIRGPDQKRWLDHLGAEHDNLRAALGWLIEQEESEAAVQMVGALWRFWWIKGHLTEGTHWLEAALALPSTSAWRSRAINGLAILAWARGDLMRAESLHRQALELRRESGDMPGVVSSLNNLALVAEQGRDFETATNLYEEGLAAAREAADPWLLALLLGNLGGVLGNRGLLDQAKDLGEESRRAWQQLGDRSGEGRVINNLVDNAIKRGDLPRAAELQRESIEIYRDLGNQENIPYCLEGAAKILAVGGKDAEAARLLGAAGALRDRLGQPISPADAADVETLTSQLSGNLGEAMRVLSREGAALEDPTGTALDALASL